MPSEIDRTVEVLNRTPAVLRTLLGGLPTFWTHHDYGPATFSPFDVVGHLIHAERTNWLPRLKLILTAGPSTPLPAFDRYAMYEASRGKSLGDLLETFAALRAQSIADLRSMNLTQKDLARPGFHPQLGEVTIGQVLAAWPVHDLGHTHQVVKAMAYQYRDEVGPFRQLLTILPRVATDDS